MTAHLYTRRAVLAAAGGLAALSLPGIASAKPRRPRGTSLYPSMATYPGPQLYPGG